MHPMEPSSQSSKASFVSLSKQCLNIFVQDIADLGVKLFGEVLKDAAHGGRSWVYPFRGDAGSRMCKKKDMVHTQHSELTKEGRKAKTSSTHRASQHSHLIMTQQRVFARGHTGYLWVASSSLSAKDVVNLVSSAANR